MIIIIIISMIIMIIIIIIEIIASGFKPVEEIDVQNLLKALHLLLQTELLSGQDGIIISIIIAIIYNNNYY